MITQLTIDLYKLAQSIASASPTSPMSTPSVSMPSSPAVASRPGMQAKAPAMPKGMATPAGSGMSPMKPLG